MAEIFGLLLAILALPTLFCWVGDLCHRRLRQQKTLSELSLVILGLIQELQLHRGLSGALLDNRQDFKEKLEANEDKLARSLNSLAELYGKQHKIFRDQRWQIVLARWEALQNNWRGVSFETSIYAHREVISGLIEILQALADKKRRQMDRGQLRGINDWLPLIENLGILRAMGLHLLGHHPTHEDELHVDKIATKLNAARGRLKQVAEDCPDHSLVVRTERVFQRVAWLLAGNAERYHPYTYYEEITAVIDDWYALLRHRLQEPSVDNSIAQQLISTLKPHPQTS